LDAVLFDLEGTLVETQHILRSSEAVERERQDMRRKVINHGIPAYMLGGENRPPLIWNLALDWAEKNMDQSEISRLNSELDGWMKETELENARKARLYSDTLNALFNLASRGIEMGLVTNASGEVVNYMLSSFDLKKFFRTVVTRNDSSRLKPDPAIIQVAISRMETPVGWLVGDAEYDAGAAYEAGLKSIIIRRDGKRPSFSHDHFINSLNDVARIVLREPRVL
jgi:HAD superfamily hydrolase (TIGR01549 family)